LLGAALCVRTVGYGPLLVAALALLAGAIGRGRGDGSAEHLAGAAEHPVGSAEHLAGAWRWRGAALLPLVAFGLAAAVPIGAYAGWSAAEGRGFTVSAHSGFFLYGRVAPFADCATITRADLRTLCDPRPVGERGAPVRYLWPADSPLRQGNRRIPPGREDLAATFAHEVVRDQPWMLVTSSLRYLAGYLDPAPYETARTSRADTWEFPTERTNVLAPDDPHADDGYFVATDVRGPSGLLAAWSTVSYPLMPLVGLGLLAGAAAALATVRRVPRPVPGDGSHGWRRLFWLAGGSGVSTLVLSAVTSGFDYRYLGAVIGLMGLAAVVGVAGFVGEIRRRRPG
ncbi:hypothetical protein, partial [Frankia sp. R82]|uniref:hypothetical protein n=1 Tax=Frankia sp. R82 TaxID=2950553 RepID=UPI0020447E1D